MMLANKGQQQVSLWLLDDNRETMAEEIFYARAFPYSVDDLNIYFATENRPLLITQLLCCCLHRPDGEYIEAADTWAWSLNQRLQALLTIAQASLSSIVMLTSQCPHEDCLETLELPMNLTLFRKEEVNSVLTCRPEDEVELEIRFPTGNDQQHWLLYAGDNLEQEMSTGLITRINGEKPSMDWKLPKGWLPAVAEILESNDLFTGLILQAECPTCGRINDIAFDLEDYLLRQLEQQQWQLKRQVHQLASIYHWTESEIVALPKKRREEYLQFIHEAMLS